MSLSYRVSKMILYVMVITFVLIFLADFAAYITYEHDVLTQVYMAGNYVTNIPADEEKLAEGKLEYADDKEIFEEFKTFFKATFRGKSKGKLEEKSMSGYNQGGNCRAYRYFIGQGLIRNIWGTCEIVTHGGVKGAIVTITYELDPLMNEMKENPESSLFPVLVLSKTRAFRLIGG